MTGFDPVAVALVPAVAMLLVAVAVACWRMIEAAGIADRLVALDMLGLVAVALCAAAALLAGHKAMLDVALGISLIGFLGTAALAALIERAASKSPEATGKE